MTQPGISVTVEGSKELQAQFARLKDTAKPNVIRSALRGATKPVIKEARARVPVKTGKLRKSIRASVDRTRDRKGFVAKIGFSSKLFYGAFVELGFIHRPKGGQATSIPARPFLRPALVAARPQIIGSFFTALDKRIKKVIAKANK